MAKIFVILTKGKDDLNMVNVAANFSYNAVKNAGATVNFMFLGRGVENLLKDSNGIISSSKAEYPPSSSYDMAEYIIDNMVNDFYYIENTELYIFTPAGIPSTGKSVPDLRISLAVPSPEQNMIVKLNKIKW